MSSYSLSAVQLFRFNLSSYQNRNLQPLKILTDREYLNGAYVTNSRRYQVIE
jgi:hypothetical protein